MKNKIIAEETIHPGFSSTDERHCNKKVRSANPGPGTYIDISNPYHCSLKSQVANANREERLQQEE